MAEHFKYNPSDDQVVTPWNARYTYPAQSNKATKMTPRIPPKNGSSFQPGQIIRLEFPAQGYVNPLNTMIEFDVVLFAPTVSGGAYACRFQNNIACIFNRVRLLYGSSPQEDLLQYNVLVRALTEWTTTNHHGAFDQTAITDGIGGVSLDSVLSTSTIAAVAPSIFSGTGSVATATVTSGTTAYPVGTYVNIVGSSGNAVGTYNGIQLVTGGSGSVITFASTATGNASTFGTIQGVSNAYGISNTRQDIIQGCSNTFVAATNAVNTSFGNTNGAGFGTVPNNTVASTLPGGISPPSAAINQATGAGVYCVRRYMVNLALGIMTQDKLIPTKYMASQLAIEITLEQANACIYQPVGFALTTVSPTYAIGNVNLIPEIIEFDDTYDTMFLKGLESGGVPIKFATWHYFQFTTQGASSLQLQITERSRSVKGIFCVQRRNPAGFQYDSHACFYDSNPAANSTAGSTMQQYQYRIGGRYFPAAPVQLSAGVGNTITNGGCEAYCELEKFLNIVGDYRLSTSTSPSNWAVPALINTPAGLLSEYDYSYHHNGNNANGVPSFVLAESASSCFGGNTPSSMFCASINFETSNGIEISGLNAEEQSDISFNVIWSANQAVGFSIEAFTFVDVMWVLRPNNYLDLIQ